MTTSIVPLTDSQAENWDPKCLLCLAFSAFSFSFPLPLFFLEFEAVEDLEECEDFDAELLELLDFGFCLTPVLLLLPLLPNC